MATLITKTVKSSGGDYTSLDAACAGMAKDITLATGTDEIIRFNCYPFEDTTRLEINSGDGWVTSAGNYVEFRFVDSAGDPLYVSKYSTSAYRLTGTNELFLNFGINYLWHTEGTWQIYESGTEVSSSSVFKCSVNLAGGWQRFDGGGILVVGHTGSGWRALKVDRPMDCRWRNWIVYGGAQDDPSAFSVGFDIGAGTGVKIIEFDNCTFDDWRILYWIEDAASTITYRNCRATGITFSKITADPNADRLSAQSDYNITDKSTSTEANWGANSLDIDSVPTPTVDYVDSTNANLLLRDYTLDSNADSGYEAGDDLSGDFTTDVLNVARTAPWDMGAHELSSEAAPSHELYGWRFRNDAGGEGTGLGAWLAAEDTAIVFGSTGEVDFDTNFRIRLGLDETNAGAPVTPAAIRLRAKLNGGAAFNVDGASPYARMSLSDQFAEGAATTDHGLTAPTGVFAAGEMSEIDGLTGPITIAQNEYTIVEYCLLARSANLASDDTLEFGILMNGIDYFPGAMSATAQPLEPTTVVAGVQTATTIPITWVDPNAADVPIRPYYKATADSEWIPDGTLPAGTTAHTFGDSVPLVSGVAYDVGVAAFDAPYESIIVYDSATTAGATRKAHITAFELEAEPAGRQAHITALELQTQTPLKAIVTAFEMQTYDAAAGDPVATSGRIGLSLSSVGIGI